MSGLISGGCHLAALGSSGQVKERCRISPGSLYLFQYRERFKEDFPLPFPVSNFADRPTVGIFDSCGSRNTHKPVEFRGGSENYCGETSLFKDSCGQSHGLATERSGWCENHGINSFFPHLSWTWALWLLSGNQCSPTESHRRNKP